MKSISFVLIFLLFATSFMFAQNFRVIIEDTTATGNPGDEIALGGHVVNLTDSPLEINITRATNNIPDNWTSALCLDVCVAPWVDDISGAIAAHDSLEFSIHFFTSSEPGEGEALLVFNEPRGPNPVSYLFKAKTSSNTAVPQKRDLMFSFRLLGNYPNPFNSSTIVEFDLSERCQALTFQVFSILGECVFEKNYLNLLPGKNQILYQGVDLQGNPIHSGFYVYRLLLQQSEKNRLIKTGTFILLK